SSGPDSPSPLPAGRWLVFCSRHRKFPRASYRMLHAPTTPPSATSRLHARVCGSIIYGGSWCARSRSVIVLAPKGRNLMTCAHGLATVLALTIAVAQLPAQGIANSNPGVRGNSYPWGFSRSSRPRSFSFSTYYGGPFGFGYGSPFGFSSVTILQPYAPPPTVIIVVPRDSLIRDRDRDREREERPPEGVIRFRPRHDRDREELREKE